MRYSDSKFTNEFDKTLEQYEVTTKRIPFRSPNLNPYAEGWVGTIKRECLNHFIVLGVNHLKHIIDTFVDHYNTVRPHSGKNNNPLSFQNKSVSRQSRLGGMLNHYYWS